MSTKLEECARAIDPNPWQDGYRFSAATKSEMKRRSIEKARAVIRCLMEPNEEMTDRARMVDVETWDDCLQILRDEDSAAILRAMLQSVLDENKE